MRACIELFILMKEKESKKEPKRLLSLLRLCFRLFLSSSPPTLSTQLFFFLHTETGDLCIPRLPVDFFSLLLSARADRHSPRSGEWKNHELLDPPWATCITSKKISHFSREVLSYERIRYATIPLWNRNLLRMVRY